MGNKKKLIIVSIFLVSNFLLYAQTLSAVFDKYSEKKEFRYVSISKDMINLASLFGKEDAGNSQMLSRIDGMKVLTLKAPRKSPTAHGFFVDIEKAITSENPFETLMEARDNGVFTRVLNRQTKNNKTDVVIVSKSDSVQHFIWLNGTISAQELQNMIKK
ncbi:MAG: DUF4252 domain-containing protein [Paludibacteraceae bacterium]|nr:DUF4252 domain-containing protein [Paludibacteraceae bacterium]MBN2787101.1 DUF4252 domain-containing protein [Paludibacteraceae bacterium]